jgi:hypothetical protein
MKRLTRSTFAFAAAAAFGLAAGALFSGCPSTGITCNAGLSPCGTGCADFQNDNFNCGACGSSCQQTQICVQGACKCQTGAVTCGPKCVIPQTDPNNCGGCGIACLAAQVCQNGQCTGSCGPDAGTLCNRSCANTNTDPYNCGKCGIACAQGMGCHGGICTFDLVAACLTAGEVVGLQAGSDVLGPLTPFGTAPFALATMDGTLLSGDQSDSNLYEARLSDLSKLPEAPPVGNNANLVLADEPYVYVINSQDNTLQVLQRNGVPLPVDGGPPDAGPADGGLGLVTIQEINLGANTSPEWAAKLGTSLWVTLYAAYGAPTTFGQKVVQVDLTPLPGAPPQVLSTIDLSALPLHPFDGGTAIARPIGIVAHNGLLYAALNNLDANYAAAGPGTLARIDPVAKTATAISLGTTCLNATDVLADTDKLYVLCGGNAILDSSFNVIGNVYAGVALLNAPADAGETVASTWNVACPRNSPDAGADAGCPVVFPGSIARVGNRLYVGDAQAGRIFSVDVVGSQLVERRGYASGSLPPIQACPFVPKHSFTNVGSLVAPP